MKNRVKAEIEYIKVCMKFINAEDVITWIVIGVIVAALIACVVIAIVSCVNGDAETADKSLHLLPNGKGGFNVFVW